MSGEGVVEGRGGDVSILVVLVVWSCLSMIKQPIVCMGPIANEGVCVGSQKQYV